MTEGPEGFEEERQWTRDFWSALAPHQMGVYVNFLMEEGEDRVREAYGAAKYDRLKALKQKLRPGEPLPAQPERPRPADGGAQLGLLHVRAPGISSSRAIS